MIFISFACMIARNNNDIEELRSEIEFLKEEISEVNTSTTSTNSKAGSYTEYKKQRLQEIADETNTTKTGSYTEYEEQRLKELYNTEDVVYKTKSGTKYHRSTCRHLSKSKVAISKEKAIKQGLEPCSTCNP